MKSTIALLGLLTFGLAAGAHAQPVLSGITMYGSSANGSYDAKVGNIWNTVSGNPWKVYLSTNILAASNPLAPGWINGGDTDLSLNPSFLLSPGTNVLWFDANLVSPDSFIGFNLYFDNNLNNSLISVVVPNTPSTGTNFSAVGAGISTAGEYSLNTPGSASLSFQDTGYSVTLTSIGRTNATFDLVGRDAIGSDGTTDTVGSFTLVVTQQSDLLLSIQVSQVQLCWDSLPNFTYQVQYRSALTTNLWTSLGSPIQGDGQRECVFDDVLSAGPQRFYQVIHTP